MSTARLLATIRREFQEHPGIVVTLPQAQSRWSLDKRHCTRAFETLMAEGFLSRIGDAYLCAGGLPEPNRTHAVDACLAALEIQSYLAAWNRQREKLHMPPWKVRIAQRLEAAADPGRINISASTYHYVSKLFETEPRGSIEVKNGAKMFLLPQRPYVPVGTLRRAATYPDAPDSRSLEEVADAFKRVGLGHLTDKLDEEGPWDQTLSGGEKQRLAFARILLHSPDIVVLDEATAALDPASQIKLMELVVDRPETTLLSVGHRPELEAFHTRKIELERRSEGAKLVRDVDLPAEPALRTLWRWMRRSRMGKGARANAP